MCVSICCVVFWDGGRRGVRARLEEPPRGVVHFSGSRGVDFGVENKA
jgi:hypothetical protein